MIQGTGLPMEMTQTRRAKWPCPVGETAIYGGEFRPSIAAVRKLSKLPNPTIAGAAVAPSVAAHMSVPDDSVNTPNPKNFRFMASAGLRRGLTSPRYDR
jgi:hypothetical protein